MSAPLSVKPISAADHVSFVESRSGSFLQTPAWGALKSDWRSESLGWFNGDELVGAGLVLYRQTPVVRRYLAYLPEGPVIDWSLFEASNVLEPLLRHLKSAGTFAVKIGPHVVTKEWHAGTLKGAIAAGTASRLADVPPDSSFSDGDQLIQQLRTGGWRRDESEHVGFGDLQPRYVFQVQLAQKSLDEVFAGFNQLWRRNIRKAEKSGVVVSQGSIDDLAEFHRIYTETAQRDHFTPRPLVYFQRMWRSMRDESKDRIRLYLAHHEGDLVAATTWVHVNEHVWYSYGASTNSKREVRASNAIQWQMIKDAHEVGARTYDLRGISDTLSEKDPLFGLIRFKLGTGGSAREYVGEWDYPINKPLHWAFQWYMARR